MEKRKILHTALASNYYLFVTLTFWFALEAPNSSIVWSFLRHGKASMDKVGCQKYLQKRRKYSRNSRDYDEEVYKQNGGCHAMQPDTELERNHTDNLGLILIVPIEDNVKIHKIHGMKEGVVE